MPNQTKDVIIHALLELLGEKPADKITVKDIVERCGVNRNTFYYHFRDIPDAVDYAFRRELRRIMDEESPAPSITRTLIKILDYMEDKKALVLHVYRSMRQDTMIYYIREILSFIVDQLAKELERWKAFPPEDQEVLKYFCRCFFEGILKDWLDSGMKYDLRERVRTLSAFFGEEAENAGAHFTAAPETAGHKPGTEEKS